MLFRVLSLGGGGYLGLFTAQVLAKLEEHLGGRIRDHFDLVCGTSIGGIIATGVSKGVPADDIVRMFIDNGDEIFREKWPFRFLPRKLLNSVTPIYSSDKLKETLLTLLSEEETLQSLYEDGGRRLSVSAVNLTQNRPHDFKTPFTKEFFRDRDCRLIDVCLATSAAPTYFPTHKVATRQEAGTVTYDLFCDGGVYANSPDFVGLFDATHFLHKNLSDVSMLSIGTPFSRPADFKHSPASDGYLRWVNYFDLPGLFTHLQETNTVYVMRRLLGERYHRVKFRANPDLSLELDDTSAKNKKILLGMADHAFNQVPDAFFQD